jgi:hypothetical protein
METAAGGVGNLNLDLGGLDNVGQQFVDPQPNHISPKPGEMDPIGFIAIFSDKSLREQGSGFPGR